MFFVCQLQPHNDEVEVIYSTPDEKVAYDECDRQNTHFADAGIPGDYHYFVL